MDKTASAILAACAKGTDPVPFEDLLVWLRSLDRDGTPDMEASAEGRGLVQELLRTATFKDVDEAARIGEVLRGLLDLDAPRDLDCFMQAMEFDRDPESRLWLPRRRHLWRLCQELQWLETDPEAQFLSVSMPPRTAKSSTCNLFMTWHMGRNPLKANLTTACSDKLTKHFYEQCVSFLTDPEYRFAELFPDAKLVRTSADDESLCLRRKLDYPTLTCRSIEGTLTGAVEVGEGGILMADDLVKDLEESRSPRRLDNKWDAYVNQAYDRRKKGARQLMIGTRWAVDDPIGRMLRLKEGEPGVHVLTIPALDPVTGESNFDYGHGLGFDTAYYTDMARVTDPVTFAAKYKGEPIVAEGLLFPTDKLQRYLALPPGRPTRTVAVFDTKDKGKDYCAAPVAATWDGSVWYIVDALCDNSAPVALHPKCAAMLSVNGVTSATFESNATGGGFADKVADLLLERGTLCAVNKRYTSANKETRILAASAWVLDRCVFKDPSLYAPHSDYGRFMAQLTGYTLEGKNAHDDAPDSMAMLAEVLSKPTRAKAVPIRRPF